jgi:hypothetical protein
MPAVEPVQLANVLVEGVEEEETTTDKNGRYRIGGLRPGKYRVKVSFPPRNLPPETRTDGSKEVHYQSTYYPGAATSAEATRVSVPASGEGTGIDIPLLTTPIVKVSGQVRNIPAGAKAVSIAVGYDSTPNSSEGFEVPVAKDGLFGIWGLEPGRYRLRAETGESNEMLQSAPIELDMGTSDIQDVELRLVPPFAISGHVEYEDDQAREQSTQVEEGTPKQWKRVILLSDVLRSSTLRAPVGDDDSFQLERVDPGPYRVAVFLGHTYVKSVRLGSAESDDRELDLRNGPGEGALTVLLSAHWGEIGGTVGDSNGPVGGAAVLEIQERGITVTHADSSGNYRLGSLPPGTYKLIATADPTYQFGMTEDEVEDHRADLVTVELHAGDRINKDLKISAAGKL